MATLGTAIKDGGRFITRPDLNLHEVGALAAAITHVRTLYGCSMGVFKSLSTTENVVDFLPLEVHFILKLGLNAINVGACPAEEAEVPE